MNLVPSISPLQTAFWELLPCEDKIEFISLREALHAQHCSIHKDHTNSTFQNDLQMIYAFIERRPDQKEIRSIVSGICFAGNYICVNTRQLKHFIGRCKSSINNGFQQLGYVSAKTKVRNCIISALPSLLHDPALLRQWTMRFSENQTNADQQPFWTVSPKSFISAFNVQSTCNKNKSNTSSNSMRTGDLKSGIGNKKINEINFNDNFENVTFREFYSNNINSSPNNNNINNPNSENTNSRNNNNSNSSINNNRNKSINNNRNSDKNDNKNCDINIDVSHYLNNLTIINFESEMSFDVAKRKPLPTPMINIPTKQESPPPPPFPPVLIGNEAMKCISYPKIARPFSTPSFEFNCSIDGCDEFEVNSPVPDIERELLMNEEKKEENEWLCLL
ncbi:hypothetical protein TRFO_07779 [Tritrichomonas foetus]|uniref:Initiator binding domain-containing protein n=1 Tax=Tritrichomonas foetus TaxID=1144522 RepID=A0A1J4JU65_9EUKA|nr:hypothetical protein TRFO_07779 [Tritrichomonas foetus]|eukprot:OHT00797.1 hypothetical protein TRFO_07779 [Tritrichomonas foetus]